MAKKTKRRSNGDMAPHRAFLRWRKYQERMEDEQHAADQEITARVSREQRAQELERLRAAAAELSMDELARLARYSEFILAHDRATSRRG